MAVPDRLLEDGEHADFPGWRMRAVHTPGHTPGHLCFAEERTGLFFSGDHVLPRISPNISTTHDGTADPLGDYLDVAGRGGGDEPAEVLPAHEWRFRGLADRDRRSSPPTTSTGSPSCSTRSATHPRHHAVAAGRPPDLVAARGTQYERRMRIFAVTETDAHLRLLASRGLVTSSGGAVPTWTLAVR